MSCTIRLIPVLAFLAVTLPGAAGAQAPAAGLVLSGRLISAGGGDVRGERVFARAGALADSAAVDSTGRFALELGAAGVVDSVEVWVDAADTAARVFAPARLRLAPDDAAREQEIVLVPLRWTIRSGRYAGREVDVPLQRAFRGACAGCTGFYRGVASRVDSRRTVVRGWPAGRFPLRVAFDRDWNGQDVTPRDSATFWREADELNESFGAGVFRPASFPETMPRDDGGPDDVILVWFDPEMHGISGLGTAVSQGDDIQYGDVRLQREALRDEETYPGLVEHELMHALGFGHTCAWRSVLADARRCPALRASTATEEDVAYAQLAAALGALVRDHGRRWGLEAAIAAMQAPWQPALAAR